MGRRLLLDRRSASAATTAPAAAESERSVVVLRHVLSSVRVVPTRADVGRPHWRAETASQTLELRRAPGGQFELFATVEAGGIEPRGRGKHGRRK
jgi:hypothetical protein